MPQAVEGGDGRGEAEHVGTQERRPWALIKGEEMETGGALGSPCSPVTFPRFGEWGL